MRAQVVQVDQQLRLVSSPAYSPLDRDKALAEQNVSGLFLALVLFYGNSFSFSCTLDEFSLQRRKLTLVPITIFHL